MDEVDRVLSFWLGEPDEHGLASAEKQQRWWRGGPELDEEMRALFLPLHRAIAASEREAWLESAPGALAYVIVLDQFSRNMFRGTPGMFSEDAKARAATEHALARGFDRELGTAERGFLYMPLMHSESLEDQERCCALFARLANDPVPAIAANGAGSLKFAEAHRDIVARFGRFPHRNAILGRESTAEELEFLTQPNSSF